MKGCWDLSFDRDFAKFRITISKYFKIGRARTEIQGRKEPKAQAAAIGGRPPFCRARAAGPPISKDIYPSIAILVLLKNRHHASFFYYLKSLVRKHKIDQCLGRTRMFPLGNKIKDLTIGIVIVSRQSSVYFQYLYGFIINFSALGYGRNWPWEVFKMHPAPLFQMLHKSGRIDCISGFLGHPHPNHLPCPKAPKKL